jgi:hypothetical protein
MSHSLPLGQVLVGDMRKILAAWPDNSIDAGTMDPPYEINIGGNAWDRSGVAYDPVTWAQTFRVLKPGSHIAVCGGTRKHHRVWCAIEDAGFEIRDTLLWLHAQGMSHASELSKVVEREDVPDADEIERMRGRASRLRPLVEPICLARKPLEGTLLENLRTYGTGALNVDACRTALAPDDRPGDAPPEGRYLAGSRGDGHVDGMRKGRVYVPNKGGRWPSNVLVSHTELCEEDGPCAPGCPVQELDEQSGIQRDGTAVRHRGSSFAGDGTWGKLGHKPVGTPDMTYGGSGGASRYYTVFRYIAKPSRSERDMGLVGRNPHQTVKPLALMRWLVRLVTPERGTVLDAFCGSGTTLAAAELEGRSWIGVDLEPRSASDAVRRALAGAEIAGNVTAKAARSVDRPIQIGMFGVAGTDGDG